MDKLPKEILHYIFKYLHYQQKKECKLVCRSWAECLRSGLELETISILNARQHDALRSSHRGPFTSCKRLVLHTYQPLEELALIFPNLRFAAFAGYDRPQEDEVTRFEEYTPMEASQFFNWNNNLEIYINRRYSYRDLKVLNTDPFQKLITIELEHYGLDDSPLERLITRLNKTPVLGTLKVHWFSFGYQDLNNLHETVPRLHTLALYFCTETGPEPPNRLVITPAEAMKRLYIYEDGGESFYSQPMYTFMARKYPKLQCLTLPTTLENNRRQSIPLVMLSNKNLIELNFNSLLNKPDVLNTMIQHLPSSLQKLSLSMEYASCIQGTLIGTNIVSLKLMDILPYDIHLLNGTSNLKELQLEFVEVEWETGAFEAILNKLADDLTVSLETLGLSRCIISANSEQLTQWRHSSLKRLELYECKIEDDISPCLSSDNFPKLRALVLDRNTMKHSLVLPDKHFALVDIRLVDDALKVDGNMYKYPFRSKQHDIVDSYINEHDNAMYLVASPSTLVHDNFFQFECKSVHTLLYNCFLVLG